MEEFRMAQEVTPDAIMQLGFGYWGSKTLLSAVEMGLFTELAKSRLGLDDIRARLNRMGHRPFVQEALDAFAHNRIHGRSWPGVDSHDGGRRRK